MTSPFSAELYRQDGAEFRAIRLSVGADGEITLSAQDMGPMTEQMWGDSDYEFWVKVPATALPKLLFALLREKYSGQSKAVDDFNAFCQNEGIEHSWDNWV